MFHKILNYSIEVSMIIWCMVLIIYKHHQVIALLKKFKVNDMFNSLRNGLDTNVGKNGEKVSGGQRQ